MLKLRISGTKNELKSFRKWLLRATKILPKYQINDDPVFKQNRKESIYYHYEADLLKPLDMEGGKGYVQSNLNSEPKGWVGKTTTTANLGIGLARKGKKVLLIDADSQGDMSISLGYQNPDEMDYTLARWLRRICKPYERRIS